MAQVVAVRGDPPAAAVRICADLGARTHQWDPDEIPVEPRRVNPPGRPARVMVGGRIFPSINEAARHFKVSGNTIHTMMRTGRDGKVEDGRATNGGHKQRAVIVDGRRFEKAIDARKALKMGWERLRRLLKEGKRARYA